VETGLDLAAAHGFACRIHIAAAVADHPTSATANANLTSLLEHKVGETDAFERVDLEDSPR